MNQETRRTTLKILGAGAASLPLLAQTAQAKVFDAAQMSLLAELTDRIIPRTSTPGAADAGVPLLIDRIAASRPETAKQWRDLLAYFTTTGGATPDSRLALLTRISTESGTEGARHFRLLKDTTIDQYYSTKQGLVEELGWAGNTFVADFQGCTHPEHQS